MTPKRPGIIKIPSVLSALRSPNYRLWFIGQSTSLIGTWMQSVAQQWVVYEMTGSKFMLGAMAFASSFPTVLLMLPSGVLADRFPRRNILLFTQMVMMLLAFILAGLIASGGLAVWHLFGLAVLLGVTNALDAPARQAFAVEMVDDRSDLYNAIALNATIFNLARFIGPALAGFILAVWGPAWCFALNGISFLAVLAGLLLMRLHPHVKPTTGEAWGEVLEGLRFSFRHPVILPLMLVTGSATCFAFSYASQLPAFAVEVLFIGEEGLGMLMAAIGLGALIGSLVVAAFSRTRRQGGLFRLGSVLFPGFVILFALSRSYPLSLGLLAVVGFGLVVQNASINTMIQTHINDEMRGRVMSIYLLVFFSAVTFGALLAGFVAQMLGASTGVALSAVVGLLCLIGIYTAFPRIRQI